MSQIYALITVESGKMILLVKNSTPIVLAILVNTSRWYLTKRTMVSNTEHLHQRHFRLFPMALISFLEDLSIFVSICRQDDLPLQNIRLARSHVANQYNLKKKQFCKYLKGSELKRAYFCRHS